MPHTVPNRPTNGAVEPTVARNVQPPVEPLHLAADGHVHHLLDPELDAGHRLRTLRFARSRFHSRMRGDEQRRHAACSARD